MTHTAPPRGDAAAPTRASEAAHAERVGSRSDFPMLAHRFGDTPFIYLDNAATTQKPRCVIDRMAHFYCCENSNRPETERLYYAARAETARFIGATARELVFVPSATAAINLVAHSWGRQHLGPGDEIVVSGLEHLANVVPWQEVAQASGARLRVAMVESDGSLRAEAVADQLSARTKLVAVAHVSNVLGTVTPIAQITAMAHRAGALVLVDGAQAVAHLAVDVTALDVDFYAFSAHKVFGPSGIGALYVRHEVMEAMPCWSGGPNAVEEFSFEHTRYAAPPRRFEAGVANIAGALGLATAVQYVQQVGFDAIARHESDLIAHARERLRCVPGLRLIGDAQDKVAIQSFVVDGSHPDAVKARLARAGVEVQAGQFLAHPLFAGLGLDAAVRMSIAFYNTRADIDVFVDALGDGGAAGGPR